MQCGGCTFPCITYSCGLILFHERAINQSSPETFVGTTVPRCLAVFGVRSGKSLGLPSDKSLLASKCLQYGANHISTVYFKSFVGMLGLEVSTEPQMLSIAGLDGYLDL